jgi:hypothetical protein
MNLDFNQIAVWLIGFSSGPIAWRAGVTFLADEYLSQRRIASFDALGPRAINPGRVMPNMLVVPAFQLGHPMGFFVLVITNNFFLHGSEFFNGPVS